MMFLEILKPLILKLFKIDEDIKNLNILNDELSREIKENEEIFGKEIASYENLIKELKDEIDSLRQECDIPTIREEHYINKWERAPITYKAQYGIERDVRTLIPHQSSIISNYIKRNRLDVGSDDEKAIKILRYVNNKIDYVGDLETHKATEFWQHPEETIQTCKGDCEDMSLLIKAFCNLSGIPDYKVKVCAGWVKSGKGVAGHCYCIYLRDDDTWCVLDACYYYSSVSINRRKEHKDIPEYNPFNDSIWWTFTQKYTYAQNSTCLKALM